MEETKGRLAHVRCPQCGAVISKEKLPELRAVERGFTVSGPDIRCPGCNTILEHEEILKGSYDHQVSDGIPGSIMMLIVILIVGLLIAIFW